MSGIVDVTGKTLSKEFELTTQEWGKVQTVQQLLSVKKNELALMEGGMKKIIEDLGRKYGIPEGSVVSMKDGKLVIVEESNGSIATVSDGQAK